MFLDDLEPDYVEYYFDLNLDNEISRQDLCQGVNRIKAKDFYLDIDYECPDVDVVKEVNIYQSSVTPEDIEEC